MSLVVRGLGGVLAVAFASVWVQLDGLIGSRGILPAAELLAFARERLGASAYLAIPSWLWLGASDGALHGVCAVGAAASLAVVLGRIPRTALALAWSCYLSLCSVGGDFLSYQWDALLLESTLVGLFAAPPGSRLGLFMMRALLFKLMFLSGAVKLLSGDPTWRDLSALSYHWWSQPLPTWTSWYAALLPAGMQSALTLATLSIELLAPLAIFAPRRVRLAGAALFLLLQLGIAATGNYGFFNLLTLVLCASLLDDRALPARSQHGDVVALLTKGSRAGRVGFAICGATALALGALAGVERLLPRGPLSAGIGAVLAPLAPLRSFNAYGLFAVMTTDRLEIALEGSSDGKTWRAYEFRFKPGDPGAHPRFAAPHMPRLDWQMWFAALGDCRHQPWLHALLVRLLQGSGPAGELLANQPFPDAPPRFLRTPLARYRFAPAGGRDWWTREPVGAYCPTVTLRDGGLAIVREPALP